MASTEGSAGRDISIKRGERMIRRLCEGQTDALELADTEHLTLARLARWVHAPKTADMLEAVCRINDVRAQLLITRYRTLAAARLFELARDDGGGETARKACVDLLQLCRRPEESARGDATSAPDATGDLADASPALQHDLLRALLAEISSAQPADEASNDASNRATEGASIDATESASPDASDRAAHHALHGATRGMAAGASNETSDDLAVD